MLHDKQILLKNEVLSMKSNLRNEIKSYIVRSGYTMQEVVDLLSEDYAAAFPAGNHDGYDFVFHQRME